MASKKIDINKAGIEELSSLVGVGRAKAEAIIESRKTQGGFKTVKDLLTVQSIGRSILDQNQGLISCSKVRESSHSSSSESYCLRDRGEAVTSLSSSPSSAADSYCLRERTECSKPSKTSPQKGEPTGYKNQNSCGHQLRSPRDHCSACIVYQRNADSHFVDTNNASESDDDEDSEIQFKNPLVACGVFSDSESTSSHEYKGCCPSGSDLGEETPVLREVEVGACDDCAGAVTSDHAQGMAASLRSRSSLPGADKSVMKRKSEGGGSKDGSPEKKPCRSSSEGCKHEGQSSPPSSASTAASSKSTERASHPFLRKGRIPSKANPPPELANWLKTFQAWSHAERLMALDELMEQCEPTQVRHVMQVIEPQFQRDFISLLPKELALYVLSFLGPLDLCRAAQTCQYWRVLAEDNLLWREKCMEENIDEKFVTESRAKGGRRASACKSPWKAAFMRQQQIEHNWREAKIRPPKVLRGHDDHVITCLEFYGTKIVSGSDDNTLKVWSAITGRCLRTLVGHTGGVWSSQMRDNIIISGSTDRTLKVWNAETGLCDHTLYGHTSTVRCMCLHGNKVVSGSRDATLRVWNVEDGQCLHVLMGHVAAVRCVQYDGRRVVSGAYDYMVKVWDPDTETCLHTLSGHTNRVYSLQFDGAHIVSGSLDTSIRVWEVESGQCLHTLIGHQSLTSGMELKDNILVSGNADSTVKVWDIRSGQCLQTLQGVFKHQSAVTCLQFNKKFVITSSDDGTVKMWSLRTGCFLRNLVSLESGGSGGVVWRIRASNTKLVCAVGSRNGTEETKLLVLDFDVDVDGGEGSSQADTTTVDDGRGNLSPGVSPPIIALNGM